MAYDFNADDIFEMAEQIESNGVTFYQKTAARTDNVALKKLLNHLADMEMIHKNTFKSLRKDLSAQEKAATAFDPNDESLFYLQTLVDSRVSFEPDVQADTIEATLKGAIDAEKNTIIFYLAMKEAVPATLGKEKIDYIIKEEMLHIRILTQEIMKLKKATP
ncbi:MAG: ferritin family protein [Thiomargarita sp.]|nr:ferritin family protein [Thiomargarita sp.]